MTVSMTITALLAGPFPTSRELTDYSDEPGWAILPAERPKTETETDR